MEEVKILLNSATAVTENDSQQGIEVGLKQNARLFLYDAVSGSMDLYQLYSDERDACEKYRLIFTVNTFATNVLFNNKTEVMINEGSSGCKVLSDNGNIDPPSGSTSNKSLTLRQAIRDTEYSHSSLGPYVYHCGADIFNNHMLRSKGFVHIQKLTDPPSVADQNTFNTIDDYRRRFDGERVVESLPYNSSTSLNPKALHVYQQDNIDNMFDAYDDKIWEKDGWIGFSNPTNIAIPNGVNGQVINKLLNNNKGGEFIDMYPDRSLFSFIPKYNKYRKRDEPNWDYCLTYPYLSDREAFIDVMLYSMFGYKINKGNAMYKDRGIAIVSATTVKTNAGIPMYQITSIIKHNLKIGDSVRLYGNANANVNTTVKVATIGKADGTDKEHVFNVYSSDISDFLGSVTNYVFSFKKIVVGVECDYYIRKFKKLRRDDGETLRSCVSKMAYGENIYGDRTAEVVYNDTINLNGITNNLGMPLNELYFTIVKNNSGWREWYENDDFTNSAVTYSHCFGKVTSGYNLGERECQYNIKKLHNVNQADIKDGMGGGLQVAWGYASQIKANSGLTESRESYGTYGITEKEMDEFFGDIVEFDKTNFVETSLEPVYHRFNTAQRETMNNRYYNLYHDDLVADDYEVEGSSYSQFTVVNEKINCVLLPKGSTTQKRYYPGNLQLEGYYYEPHHKVTLKKLSNRLNTAIGTKINEAEGHFVLMSYSSEDEANILTVHSDSDYGFVKGDMFAFCHTGTCETFWGVLRDYKKVDDYIELNILTTCEYPVTAYRDGSVEIMLTDGSIPHYAIYDKFNQAFKWRDIVPMSQLQTTDSIYNMPYSNGCHYIHTNVNLFVRRQDPDGRYGLLAPDKYHNSQYTYTLARFRKYGEIIDLGALAYEATNSLINACI